VAWVHAERRKLLVALDALFFHLYGLAADDIGYIMDTFPIVRDMERATYKDYRLKNEILAAYAEISTEGLSRFRDIVSR
jgi:hypothetical protein